MSLLAPLQLALDSFAHEVRSVFGRAENRSDARERPSGERGDHLLREFRFAGHRRFYQQYECVCQYRLLRHIYVDMLKHMRYE
jgi:hypothetical protein